MATTTYKNARFCKELHCFRCGADGPGFEVSTESGQVTDFPLCAETCLVAMAEAMSGEAPPSKGPGKGRKAATRNATPVEADKSDALAPVAEPIEPTLFNGPEVAR